MTIVSAIGQAAGALSAVNNIANLLSGASAMMLGDVPLTDFALPAEVGRGTVQQYTVHKFPGGARWVDAMGGDPAPITWKGTFFGINAAAQARRLEAMVEAGAVVNLNLPGAVYRVAPQSCTVTQSYARADYVMTCIVIPTQPPAPETPDTSILSDIAGGLAAAQAALAKAQAITAAAAPILGAVGVSVGRIAALQGAFATAGGLAGAAGGLVAGSAAIGSTLDSASTAVSLAVRTRTAAGLDMLAAIGSTATGIGVAEQHAGVMALATQARGFAGRVVGNINQGGLF
jgi:hypothetical protein